MNWLRLYHDALDDPKVQRLAPPLFKAWVNLLCLASKAPERGTLPAVDDIAFALRMDADEAAATVAELTNRGLLDEHQGRLVVHGWAKRQPRSDNVTERVRNHRERAKHDETLPERSGNALDTERDTEKETEKRRETPPLTPPSPPVAESPSPRVSPPFPLLAALCDELGTDVSVLTADQRSKQLAVGKRLVAAGLTDADVRRMVRWLSAQSWVTGGVDLFLLEKQLGKWQLAGKPERVPATARAPTNGKRDIGYTTAQLKAMAEGGHG